MGFYSFTRQCKLAMYYFLMKNRIVETINRGACYRIISTPKDAESFQLEKFNNIWTDAYKNIPFYKEWKEKYKLPDSISTLDELSAWPILGKIDLQENKNKLLRENCNPTGYIKTGGSTGEPLQLPVWSDNDTSPSMWLGRASYGIEPGMKTFLLWGHHHLYGKGFIRYINTLNRTVKDWASNMKRVSAYDLSQSAMINAFKTYRKYNPQFVIGFSASILAFCRVNSPQSQSLGLKPKLVLCTAGPLSASEIEEIESFFQAPVCMEYGSVECAVMAYTDPLENQYKIFWDTHLIQGIVDNYGEVKNIVTRLTSCYFPLIRYDVGDYLDIDESENLNSILKVIRVKGRPTDMIELKNGTSFFGALIGDCIKQVDGIISNQLHVYTNGILINVVALSKINQLDLDLIKDRLLIVVPSLKELVVLVKQVENLSATTGGKVKLVVRHSIELNTDEAI